MYADIHQWYLAVNDAIPTTEKYEDMILKFYQKLGKTIVQRICFTF